MIMQTTLTLAAAAALINLWITLRISQLRYATKTIHGDGGHPLLARRMRTQANFTENVPLVLILIGLIEITGHAGQWLAILGGVFIVARIAHVFGMDKDKPNAARGLGAMITMLTQLILVIVAVLIALGRF